VTSRATPRFWAAYRASPADIQALTQKACRLFRENPGHPSLHVKKVHDRDPTYSARVTFAHRAVDLVEDDEITWFWIGTHAEYDRLLHQLSLYSVGLTVPIRHGGRTPTVRH
jgi:Txe/YoeB family toxin of Txe-Axe toxin-antitoxin module